MRLAVEFAPKSWGLYMPKSRSRDSGQDLKLGPC